MAERSYFSLRYAIPGYTFLLLFISINYRVVLSSFQTGKMIPEFLDMFFAFLIALSGSAIGFPVSQSWFLWCKCRNTLYNAPRKAIATFSRHYDIITVSYTHLTLPTKA